MSTQGSLRTCWRESTITQRPNLETQCCPPYIGKHRSPSCLGSNTGNLRATSKDCCPRGVCKLLSEALYLRNFFGSHRFVGWAMNDIPTNLPLFWRTFLCRYLLLFWLLQLISHHDLFALIHKKVSTIVVGHCCNFGIFSRRNMSVWVGPSVVIGTIALCESASSGAAGPTMISFFEAPQVSLSFVIFYTIKKESINHRNYPFACRDINHWFRSWYLLRLSFHLR